MPYSNEKNERSVPRIRGLVVREIMIGETDKLLSVLTAEYGRISVMAKGARSIKSKYMMSSQLMCFSEITVYQKSGRFWLREALPIETFYPIRLELDCYALVQYFFDICCELCPDGHAEGADEMLRLMLNTLYAIMTCKKSQEQIKAAFEFKAIATAGFAPELSGCADCGLQNAESMILDLIGGTLRCGACVKKSIKQDINNKLMPLNETERGAVPVKILAPSTLEALRFIENASVKRFLSFSLAPELMNEFCAVCEAYLCNQLERGFETLEFWHQLRSRYAAETK